MKKVLFIFLAFASLLGCNTAPKQKQYVYFEGLTQGTFYHVKYFDSDMQNFQPQIDSLLANFDLSLSTYIPNSIISRMNRNEADVLADDKFVVLFNESKDIWTKSNGAFDLTIAPLADVWGFGSGQKADSVPQRVVDSLLLLVGMDKVWIENNKLIKTNPAIQLNVNAIAQGYAVDLLGEFLESKGVENYMVEIGGEVRTKGINDKGKIWVIGIDTPSESNDAVNNRQVTEIIQVSNRSTATSGNYRQFYEAGGKKYAHIIDPKDGKPKTTDLLSVTIIADNCMRADGYATACMVIGYDESKKLISGMENIEAFFIYIDENEEVKTDYTSGFETFFMKDK